MMNMKVDFPHPTTLPSQPSTNESCMFSLGAGNEEYPLPRQDYGGWDSTPAQPAWPTPPPTTPPTTTTPPPTTTPPTTTPPAKGWPPVTTAPPAPAWPDTEPPKAWDYGYHGASSITMNRY